MIAADQAQRSATAPGDSTGKLFVGMDIGGTKTAAVVIDEAGNLGAETLLPTAQGNDGVLDGCGNPARLRTERGHDIPGVTDHKQLPRLLLGYQLRHQAAI